MDQVYQQDLSQESPRPGGPFLIQMLFREPTELPDRDTMLRVLQQHCGRLDCFCHDEKMAGFAALDHMATFQDGSAPVQLMVTACSKIPEDLFDPFTRSQMWDCMGERDQILAECRWQIVGVDMLTAALGPLERADLDMDFLGALAELFPTCVAFYFQNCGKLFADPQATKELTDDDVLIPFVNPTAKTNEGGKVTFNQDMTEATITPDSGYAIKDVLLNGKSVGKVAKLDKLASGDTIQVVFEKLPASNPATGDTMPIVAVFALLAVSGAGVLLLRRRVTQ